MTPRYRGPDGLVHLVDEDEDQTRCEREFGGPYLGTSKFELLFKRSKTDVDCLACLAAGPSP